MALNKSEILDAIAGMTVLELSGLIKDMEEKFGVSAAAAAVAVAAPAGGGGAAASDTMVLNGKSMKENRVVHTEDQIIVLGILYFGPVMFK